MRAGRFEVNTGKIFAEIVEGDAVSRGAAAAGAEGDAGGAGEGLAIAGEGDPEAAADLFGRARTDDEGESAVVIGKKGGVDGVERVFGVEEDLAEGAARAVSGGEKKFHVLSLWWEGGSNPGGKKREKLGLL